MAGPRYSVEQLEKLRESKLVKKPEGLPSILQWMDVPADQNNSHTTNNNNTTRRPRNNLRDGDAAGAGEHRTDRPLINPMGQFGRRASMQPGEDTVLGPPKLAFASASRTAKAAGEAKERTGITSIDGDHLGDRFPRERGERWTRDRDGDRNRDKGYTNGRRAAREDGDGWTNVKGRKSLGQEDFDRGFGRNGDRNRDRKEGDADDADAPTRRGNRGDKFERWGRRDDTTAHEGEGNRFGRAGQGGWRDRERDRERDRDRDWNRGGNKIEEDPEWMDEPVDKKDTKIRTQEDFQRWKEQMKAKDMPVEEKVEPKADTAPSEAPTSISANLSLKTAPVLGSSDAHQGIFFGNWAKDKPAEASTIEPIAAKPKPDKKSRFMTMFSKAEEPVVQNQPPAITPASPAPAVDGSNADKEGFQRILQMLGGANISAPQDPQPMPSAPTNGTRSAGGIPLDFHHQSPPPEPQESRQPPRQPPPRTLEQQNILENVLAPRPSGPESRPSQQARFTSMSPDNALLEQFGLPRPESNRPNDDFPLQQPPSRNNNAQDANLAAILNSRAREESNRDRETKQRERDFLLTLMQQPSRATPPQLLNQNLARPPPDNQNLSFFDQPDQRGQGLAKGRGAPPGFMEDPRMFQQAEAMRREADRRQEMIDQQIMQQRQQEVMRNNKNPRMPMGFPGHEDPAMAGLQRRNTAGEIPRQMTNMGIPSQPIPDMPFMGGRGQPGMPPTPNDRSNVAPPPGFGPPMRQPPGLGGVPQQGMGPGPSFSAGNTPLGHPPGFPPPNNMRGGGGMFPGGPGGPGGPPQGYFPPPGYGPPMGMRGDADPRMMFEGQFGPGGPGGPPRQHQPGRPPNMY